MTRLSGSENRATRERQGCLGRCGDGRGAWEGRQKARASEWDLEADDVRVEESLGGGCAMP